MIKRVFAIIITAFIILNINVITVVAEDQEQLQTRDRIFSEDMLQIRERLHVNDSMITQQQDRLRSMDQTQLKFQDCDGHWAQSQIRSGWAFGLVEGYPDGHFGPDANVTGIEGLLMMTRLMKGLDGIEPGNNEVEDFDWTEIPDWAKLQMQEENALRLMAQNDDYLNAELNRLEVAVMLAKGLAVDPVELPVGTQLQFMDQNNIADEGLGYVLALKNLGIVAGYPDGNFHPYRHVTRAQINVMMLRVLELLQ